MGKQRTEKHGPGNITLFIMCAAFAVIIAVTAPIALLYLSSASGTDQGSYVKGVDVSVFQSDIAWNELRKEGYAFAYIKATEGSSHVDRMFESNWSGSGPMGIYKGAYHFLSFESDGHDQAANFIKTVDRKRGMLPPAVDVEFYGSFLKTYPSPELIYSTLDAVLEDLEKEYGVKPVIYTNKHIYYSYLSGRYDEYPLWISDFDVPDTMNDGRKWTFCQYSFEGSSQNINGGKSDVDLDLFRGTKWDLYRFAHSKII